MRSLTREEAGARSRLLSVQRYEVTLDLRGLAAGNELRVRSEIGFYCREPGAGTFVDCVVSDVPEVELNGEPVGPSAYAEDRIALTNLQSDNVLTVESVQHDTARRAGVHRVVDPADGEVYVWTTFEPDDARRVFACFDQPDLKARFRLRVTAPAAWTVVSNCPAEAVEDGPAGARCWIFGETPPLSTYIPVVNAGPFAERRSRRGRYDLGLFARRSLGDCLARDAEELFAVTAAGLEYFGERFGMPFPQEKYDQVFVPDLGGAMENYGCVTWGDHFVYRTPPTPAEREQRAFVVLHEMAHMWFGDLVTMQWWDDLWLNEAFADWAAVWAAAAVTEHRDAWATFLTVRKERGYAADRAPTTHPIRQPVPDVATASATFDMVTYAKGASVLKQLVAYIGQDAFVAALRTYFDRCAWSNATLGDLMSEVAIASGHDLDRWVSDWLETAGTSTLTVETDEADGRYAGVAVRQTPSERAPVLRTHRVAIGVYDRDGATLRRRERVELDLSAERTGVETLTGTRTADLLLLNDDDLTFARIRLDERSRATLLAAAGDLPTPLSRAVAASALWSLVVHGELPAADFIGTAIGLLRAETAEPVMESLLQRAVQAVDLWTPAAQRVELAAGLAEACLAHAAGAPPSRRTMALRGLARTATTEEQLAALGSAAAGDVELTWRALVRLAALDRLDPVDVAENKRADPDPDGWVRELAVDAAQPTAEAKDRAWSALVTEGRVPTGKLVEVAGAFWQRGQETLLAPYGDRFVDALPTLGRSGMTTTMTLTMQMFPLVGVDADFPDRVVAAAQSETVSPIVARTVGERADELRRMLAARSLG